MKNSVKLSVMVRVNDMGILFIACNITTKSCTKHVDIRYKYANKYVEDGMVKIVFVNSAENDNNILTHHLGRELHNKLKSWQVKPSSYLK